MENKTKVWENLKVSLEVFTAVLDKSDATKTEVDAARRAVEIAEFDLKKAA